jgi:hypothetical protein
MGTRVVSLLGAIALAAGSAVSVQASDAQAPPMLTPLVARDVTAACPGTKVYADALIRGATDEEAAAASTLFDACAASLHRRHPWREPAANVAVGAAYLSRGLLEHDPAMLQHAIDATAVLRSSVSWTDETVRRWPIIPDQFDAPRREAVIRIDCPAGMWIADAVYINIAAHQGSAWIAAPRETETCRTSVARFDRGMPNYGSGGSHTGIGGVDPGARSDPAIEPGFNGPVRPGP